MACGALGRTRRVYRRVTGLKEQPAAGLGPRWGGGRCRHTHGAAVVHFVSDGEADVVQLLLGDVAHRAYNVGNGQRPLVPAPSGLPLKHTRRVPVTRCMADRNLPFQAGRDSACLGGTTRLP